jgi:hypothetical protein
MKMLAAACVIIGLAGSAAAQNDYTVRPNPQWNGGGYNVQRGPLDQEIHVRPNPEWQGGYTINRGPLLPETRCRPNGFGEIVCSR